MDVAKILHRIVDGIAAGDWNQIAMGISLVVASLTMTYLLALGSKFTLKQGFRGVKWLVVPKPMSELATKLMNALEYGDMELDTRKNYDDDVLVVSKRISIIPYGSILVWYKERPPKGDPSDAAKMVDDHLSNRDRKRVFRKADAVLNKLLEAKKRAALTSYHAIVDTVADPKKANERSDYFERLAKCAVPVVDVPKVGSVKDGQIASGTLGTANPPASPAVPDNKVAAQAKSNGKDLCPCLDCQRLRNAKV